MEKNEIYTCTVEGYTAEGMGVARAEGMALFRPGVAEPLVIPTRARQVFDVSGAGDTVMAAMTLAICAGASHSLAASLANEAAGIVVGYVGTRAIDAGELEQVLKEQG